MKKVHLIGNAHLDPVWLWRWQEGYAEVKATFRSALDRMNEFPDYKFTSACAAYYEWIKESDPDMFDEIAERVKEGRWCITGGWYIQPDCNIPSGESFARHALISQRFFKDNFGVTANTGYNVDSFGHNGALPKILMSSGMKNYVFMRPGPHEKDLPDSLFTWEAADGSQVTAYRIPIQYNFTLGIFDNFEKVASMASEHEMMAFYGVGNHGGGPTVKLLEKMENELDDRFIYSTPNEYFDAVDKEGLPIVKDDLQFHAKGCYSACSLIKKLNRKSEVDAVEAERYLSLSRYLADNPYPSEELNRTWKNILFNQFHDIMGGCSIREAYDDAAIAHGEAQSICERNINHACQQISWSIDTSRGKDVTPDRREWAGKWFADDLGTPIVVFNPHPWEIDAFVRLTENATTVTDESDEELPIQTVRASRTNGGDKWATGFIAHLPALGYKLYRTYHGDRKEYENKFIVTENSAENSKIKIAFDKDSGELCSFYDKVRKCELLSEKTRTTLIDDTHCDTWAHGIKQFQDVAAELTTGRVELMESGPVRVMFRAYTEGENTVVRRDYYMTADSDVVEVKTQVMFREHHRMLKFRIPTAVKNPKIKCEIPFGSIERENNGDENVCHRWFCAEDKNGHGIAVLNDCKYSFDAKDGMLSLTVLRGAIYADHYAGENRDSFCEYQDQGLNEFTYAITPHISVSSTQKKAEELNMKPFFVSETFHCGELPTEFEGIHVSKENIIVTALKKHEDSGAYILRAYECEGKDTDCKITLFGRKFPLHFGHDEVKTVLVGENIRECDFMEY
jgi:alpha-mannosidase